MVKLVSSELDAFMRGLFNGAETALGDAAAAADIGDAEGAARYAIEAADAFRDFTRIAHLINEIRLIVTPE